MIPATNAAPSSTASSTDRLQRRQVRRRGGHLTAVQTVASVVDLVDGRQIPAMLGDWLITKGDQILDVVPETKLQETYEVVFTGCLKLSAEVCRLIEDRVGLGTAGSEDALLAGLTRLASIKIGEVEISFTPGQLEELAARAAKRGVTVKQTIVAVVDRLRDELFCRGPEKGA